jgi:hypothetical protein
MELFTIDKQILENKVFVYVSENEQENGEGQKQLKYYSLGINKLDSFNTKFYVLKINDVTINIQFDLNLGEKRLLELVNACVSHEMRNPINAILAMNLKLTDLVSKVFEIIAGQIGLSINDEIMCIKDTITEAIQVQ